MTMESFLWLDSGESGDLVADSRWKETIQQQQQQQTPSAICDSPASSPGGRMSIRSAEVKLTNGHPVAPPRANDVNDNVDATPSTLSVKNGLLGLNPHSGSKNPSHPLFHFGVCRWPGCESPCEELAVFIE